MRQFLRLHHRTVLALGTALAVLAVLITTVLIVTRRGDNPVTPGQPATSGPPAAAPSTGAPEASTGVGSPTAPGPGTWRALPAAPVTADSAFDGVWTGTDLLLYSPYGPSGAEEVFVAYQPASNTWRTLTPSPDTPQMREGGEQLVWTGREMLAFGVLNGAYNPATKQWHTVAAGAPAGPSATVWTGRQVLMWGGGCCADFHNDGAAYDPKTNAWTPIPAAPLASRMAPGVWTGQELIVVGGNNDEKTFADAAAYNPATKHWRKLASLPSLRTQASVTWTGTEILVVGGVNVGGDTTTVYADGYAYNPATNTWRHLPSSGVPRTQHVAVWTGSRLLVWGGYTKLVGDDMSAPTHGMAYDPATNRWSAMTAAPLKGRIGPIAVWTGTEMLVFGGVQWQPYHRLTDAAAYKP